MQTLTRSWQTGTREYMRACSLPVSDFAPSSGGVRSPYFQCPRLQKVGTGRDTHIFLKLMAKKILLATQLPYSGASTLDVVMAGYDTSNYHTTLEAAIPVSLSGVDSTNDWETEMLQAVVDYAVNNWSGFSSVTAVDVVRL